MTELCACNAQLQPHDQSLACELTVVDLAAYTTVDAAYAAEQDGDRGFDPWLDLGGEG